MDKKLTKIFLGILLTTLCHLAQGQDLHFSQFYNSPLTTNPANTGFIPDASYRIGVNYRTQYSNIMAVPYKTFSAFADAKFMEDKLENGWLGLGLVMLGDEAGSGTLKSTKIYGSVAYHQLLGYSSLLSAGFNLGYAQKRIDPSRLKFPDQFDGKFFDANRTTTVQLTNTSTNYFDLQAGLNYAYFPTDDIYINAGYSAQHVNRPNETFFDDKTSNSIVPVRHIAFANAILKVSDRVIINPNIYYSNQVGASELTGGLRANYNLSEAGETQFIAGLYYRHKESIIPVAGFVAKRLEFTFSYDVTISSLNSFNNGRGAFEFSLIKKGEYNNSDSKTLCPKF